MMVTFKVKLNGTSVNPFHRYGLRQTPFPQVAKHEYVALNWLLGNLAAEPIRDEQHLRERMKGAAPDFIEGCCQRFKPGEMVEFNIEFPD